MEREAPINEAAREGNGMRMPVGEIVMCFERWSLYHYSVSFEGAIVCLSCPPWPPVMSPIASYSGALVQHHELDDCRAHHGDHRRVDPDPHGAPRPLQVRAARHGHQQPGYEG